MSKLVNGKLEQNWTCFALYFLSINSGYLHASTINIFVLIACYSHIFEVKVNFWEVIFAMELTSSVLKQWDSDGQMPYLSTSG